MAITNVNLASDQAGVLDVSWDAPSDTLRDYRVNWAKVGESFPSYKDNVRNAYPTSNSYAITDLDGGVRYKVKVRARFDEGGPGDWAEPVETDVASSS